MRVLVACEFSGTVRDAFARRGHDAWSCDICPAPGQHIEDDVLKHLTGWDLIIAHPPCTYLCQMGVWWNHKDAWREERTKAAYDFFVKLYMAPCPKVCVENPTGYMSSHFMRPSQVIHPWQFGHEASHATCLWLRGLPKLVPTNIVGKGEFYFKKNGGRLSKWSHSMAGGPERAQNASKTFTGIARAMAKQWS